MTPVEPCAPARCSPTVAVHGIHKRKTSWSSILSSSLTPYPIPDTMAQSAYDEFAATSDPPPPPPPRTRPSSASNASAILLQQAAALAACADRIASDPASYDRAIDILHLVLEGEPYAPSLGDDELVLDTPNLSALDDRLACACARRRRARGKLVLTGVGKSGHIARKVTATLQSTGSMAVFLHPTEALHGDLGVLAEGDALVLFSNSGRSDELLALVAAVRRRDGTDVSGFAAGTLSPPPSPPCAATPIIAVCGDAHSPLGVAADAVVDAGVSGESDPHMPAPTASTTLAVAMGDCIALELARRRGFGSREFARNHPGGNLGRWLAK